MTAAELLGLITAALLMQLMVGIGVAVWRRSVAVGGGEVVAIRVSPDAAWDGWRDFRVVRRCFEDATQAQCSFYLQSADGQPLSPFKPGQFLTFSLDVASRIPGNTAAASAITRCYSLSDRPDPGYYRVTIKRVPAPADHPEVEPGLASHHFHDHVHEGSVLRVKAPSGRFFIDPNPDVPVVLIAGGIGITPIMSMLRWCVEEQPGRLVHLYYGLRSSSDHAFKRVLEDLAAAHPAFRLNVVYGSPVADDVLGRDYQHLGYIDLALLRSTLPHGRHKFYVCGPPPMMQSLVPALREWGVNADDIHFEAFGPASVRSTAPVSNEPAAVATASIDVRFSRAGRTLSWDGQDSNLLDFAERHGLAVDSGCRTGSCGTCQTRLLSGVVTYADQPDYDIPEGHCLLCVGIPAVWPGAGRMRNAA